MTSNCLSTLDFIVNQRHPDSNSTPTGGTDNGGNPGDTQPIPEGSSTPNRFPLGSTTSKQLFTTAGENEAENSELERVFVSTDGVLYENQADDIRSSLGDLRTVWSQETISITPKKHSNGFAELLKKVREFKANSHNDVEGERNSITEEAGVNDHQNGKHDINLTEIMKKLAEFRSEITILRDTVESERNGNLVLRHDIEVHKQELLRQIEVQKTIIERQQETIVQKELEACKKEREQSDDNIREANVRESIEAARDAQIAQYREEVTNLQKFFDERIQEMSSERKTYNQTVQELNTKLLEYENEITKLRNEMETERKHIQGPPSSGKYGREDSQESITRTNHESDGHKSNQILNERTERFETSDSTPTLLDSSNKGHGNNRERNKSDTDEVHRSEVDDDYILEPGEDIGRRELFKPPRDMIDNISERTTTAFKEKAFTPGNILRKDYSHPHIVKDEYSDHEISQTDQDARDSPREYGYDNYGYQDLLETQTKFPSESELEDILNGGDETVKVSKIPEKNFSEAYHHSLDTMTHIDNDMYHVYPDDSTIIALRKEIDELRKDFEKCFQTKPNDQMSVKEVTDAAIENLKTEIQTLKKVFEKIEISKPPVQPNYEDIIDTIRKEIETMKMEHEKNKNESNLTTAEDMAVVIELLKQEIQSIKNDPEKGHDRGSNTLIYEDIIRRLQDDIETLKGEHEKRQDLERTASLIEADLKILKSDFDTMKKEQNQIGDRDKVAMYDLEINALRKEIDAIKTATRNVEQESLQQGISTEMDSIKKEFSALREQQDKIRYQTERSPVQPYPPNIDLFDTMRQEIETIKDTLEKLKTKLIETGFNPSQTNQKVKFTKTNELEAKQQAKEMYQLKEISATNMDYDQVIDSLRNDIDQLKEDQKKKRDTEMASIIEAKINALVKDMEHMKLEQEKIFIVNEEQENQRHLDGTYIGVIRKEMDGLKRDQEKLKQHLEGRQDFSPTLYENIDTLQKDVDALKMEKQSLEGRKDYSPTLYEKIDALQKDVDALKMKKQHLEGRMDYSLTQNEDIIDALRKDVDALKMEKQSLEGRTDYSLTQNEDIIDALRKDVDALKMEKQSLEGRTDYSLTQNEDIIDALRKDVDALKMEKQSLEGRKDYSLTLYENIDALQKDVDALKMEKQLSSEDRCMLEALRSEVNSLRKLQEQVQYQETDSSTLTPGPSDSDEPVLDIKEGMNKEYILRDAFDQLCYECKQRDEEIEACKEDIKKLFELLQNSLARVDNERQMHVETINEKLAKYSESINKVLTVTKMQSENIEKLVDDTENEKTELRAEVDKYRNLVEGITLELQQEVGSLKKSYEQVFTLQQEIENLRTHTEEMDASTRNKLQEMSNLDNDILLRLENINAAQEDQTEKIASLSETLGQYSSDFPTLHKAMETEREEILDIQRSLQKHTQELREDLNNQLTALEAHRKEVETKTDAIQAELQELHKVNVQQLKLRKRRQVIELQDPVMKETISLTNIPVKTTVKDLGSLAAVDELFEGGLQRRANVKELEVIPTVDEIIEETQDTEERSTISSWFGAVTTRQRRKAKSNSCLGYLGRICCTALPLILLLLLFLIFALFAPFFHECCKWTNTYRHSPMYFRYVDGPPPV